MKQSERNKILKKDPFVVMNLPISIFKDEDKDKKFSVTYVMPRKETCFIEEEEFKTEEDFKSFCDKAIAAYENAVKLFKLLKERKIEHIYYFDSPEGYLKEYKNKE